MSKKIIIPIPKPYDHTKEKEIEACGLESKSFGKRNENLFKDFKSDPDLNIVSMMAECIENTFSKREMAFLMAAGQVRMMFGTAKQEMTMENLVKQKVNKKK